MGVDKVKQRLWTIAFFSVPVVAIALSVLALNSGPLLKRPASSAEDIPARIEEISTMAVAARWGEAEALAGQVDEVWDRVRGRLAFSSDSEDLSRFSLSLAELRGALAARDEQQVRIIHRRLIALWKEIGT